MKQVSIQDLKRHLSSLIAEATRGERIVVTRHSRAVAALTPVTEPHTHAGSRVGSHKLRPLFDKPATRGRYLEVLAADRRENDR